MIRILLGILLIYGVAGGIDNMPPDPSLSYVSAMLVVAAGGFGLILWGLRNIQK